VGGSFLLPGCRSFFFFAWPSGSPAKATYDRSSRGPGAHSLTGPRRRNNTFAREQGASWPNADFESVVV
jgi:hypothetical protein